MTWVAREVDPHACPYCNREQAGTRHYRSVNEPARPRPGAAPAFHCSACGRHIGKTRLHWIAGDDVLCTDCYLKRDTGATAASRAAAAWML